MERLTRKINFAAELGISQPEIAERAGVSVSTVWRISHAGRLPARVYAEAIDRAIDVALRELEVRRAIQDQLRAWDTERRSALADHLGVTTATISAWAAGTLPPWRKTSAIRAAIEIVDAAGAIVCRCGK